MKYELMLRGINPEYLDNMDMIEFQELYLYLQYFRKNINAVDLALGIGKAFGSIK